MLINVGTYEGNLMGFKDNSTLYSFNASTGSIKTLCSQGRYLYLGGSEEIIKVFDVNRKKETALLEAHSGTINIITSYEGFVLTAGDDGKICIWKTRTWDLVHSFNAQNAVQDMSVHESGKLLISCTKNNKIQLWNLMNLNRLFQKKFKFNIQKIRFLQTSTLSILSDQKVYIIDCETNKVCQAIEFQNNLSDFIVESDRIIVSDQKGYIYLVEIADKCTHRIILQYKAHTNRVKQMQLVDNFLCSISTDGDIKIWDVLEYADDQFDEINLEDKLKPIHIIRTGNRLTSISISKQINIKEEQMEEEPQRIEETLKVEEQNQKIEVKRERVIKKENQNQNQNKKSKKIKKQIKGEN